MKRVAESPPHTPKKAARAMPSPHASPRDSALRLSQDDFSSASPRRQSHAGAAPVVSSARPRSEFPGSHEVGSPPRQDPALPSLTPAVSPETNADPARFSRDALLNEELRQAVASNDVRTCKILLRLGPDINDANAAGQTALTLASERRNLELLKLLTSPAGQIDQPRAQGETLLMFHAGRGNQEIVRWLIDNGAKRDLADARGWTALMRAVWGRRRDVAGMLLDAGADANVFGKDGHNALSLAIRNRDDDMLNILIDGGAQTKIIFTHGSTLLMRAVGALNARAVERLIGLGLAVDAQDDMGLTALIIALEKECPSSQVAELDSIIRLLLDARGPVDLCSKRGITALMIAASKGNLEVCRRLLDDGAQVDRQDTEGVTPLMYAVAKQRVEVVRLLLDRGAYPHRYNSSRESALGLAKRKGFDAVRQLLEYGEKTARPSGGDLAGPEMAAILPLGERTATTPQVEDGSDAADEQVGAGGVAKRHASPRPLGAGRSMERSGNASPKPAAKSSPDELSNRLDDASQAMFDAVAGNDAEALARALAGGAAIDATDARGRTPLINAVRKGHVKVVRSLLKLHPSIDMADKAGNTALWYAVETNNEGIVKRLVEAKADVNHRNDAGQTPFLRSITARVVIFNHLAKSPHDSTIRDPQGRTGLMVAVAVQNLSAVKKLAGERKDNPDNDMTDSEGVNALSMAVTTLGKNTEKKHQILDYLCERSNINFANVRTGQNALMLAARTGESRACRILLDRGAKVDEKDRDGVTALMFAVQNNHVKIVEMLLDAGALPDKSNKQGVTARSLAQSGSNQKILALMRDHPVDVPATGAAPSDGRHPSQGPAVTPAGRDVSSKEKENSSKDGNSSADLSILEKSVSSPDAPRRERAGEQDHAPEEQRRPRQQERQQERQRRPVENPNEPDQSVDASTGRAPARETGELREFRPPSFEENARPSQGVKHPDGTARVDVETPAARVLSLFPDATTGNPAIAQIDSPHALSGADADELQALLAREAASVSIDFHLESVDSLQGKSIRDMIPALTDLPSSLAAFLASHTSVEGVALPMRIVDAGTMQPSANTVTRTSIAAFLVTRFKLRHIGSTFIAQALTGLLKDWARSPALKTRASLELTSAQLQFAIDAVICSRKFALVLLNDSIVMDQPYRDGIGIDDDINEAYAQELLKLAKTQALALHTVAMADVASMAAALPDVLRDSSDEKNVRTLGATLARRTGLHDDIAGKVARAWVSLGSRADARALLAKNLRKLLDDPESNRRPEEHIWFIAERHAYKELSRLKQFIRIQLKEVFSAIGGDASTTG